MISGVAAIAVFLIQNRGLLAVVERPEGVLADVDAVERRLGDEHLAVGHQLRQMPVDEGQEQRGDVVAVRVGIREDDDLSVAQLGQLEGLAEPASERRHEVRQFLVFEDLRQRRALGVQHLAAQRQNRLMDAVAALLGRAARRVALDDEELAAVARGVGAVAQLPGQIEPASRSRSCATPRPAPRGWLRARGPTRMIRATIDSATLML